MVALAIAARQLVERGRNQVLFWAMILLFCRRVGNIYSRGMCDKHRPCGRGLYICLSEHRSRNSCTSTSSNKMPNAHLPAKRASSAMPKHEPVLKVPQSEAVPAAPHTRATSSPFGAAPQGGCGGGLALPSRSTRRCLYSHAGSMIQRALGAMYCGTQSSHPRL